MEVLFSIFEKFNTSGLFEILIQGIFFAVGIIISLFVLFGILVLLSAAIGIIELKEQNINTEPKLV